MGSIKHPSGSGSVTPQTERGPHPRGTEAKSGDQARKMERERETPAIDPDADRAPSGPDARDTMGGRPDTLANPGIGSSPGTTDSGERGIEERDRGAGIERND
jgi:hypothetical protein